MADKKSTKVSVISSAQFGKKKDSVSDDSRDKIRFSGADGSKTMSVAGGRVPKPLSKHPHHRKAGKKTRRAH